MKVGQVVSPALNALAKWSVLVLGARQVLDFALAVATLMY